MAREERKRRIFFSYNLYVGFAVYEGIQSCLIIIKILTTKKTLTIMFAEQMDRIVTMLAINRDSISMNYSTLCRGDRLIYTGGLRSSLVRPLMMLKH